MSLGDLIPRRRRIVRRYGDGDRLVTIEWWRWFGNDYRRHHRPARLNEEEIRRAAE